MIYHEMFGQHLRLGNFLFKYAWSVAMKEKLGIETVYPDYYLWKYLQNPPLVDNPKIGILVHPRKWEWSLEEKVYIEDFLKYTESQNQDSEIALNFFFQSEKWFRGYKDEVFKALTFKDVHFDRIFDKYQYLFARPTIGLGIRLGDFQGHGDFYQIPITWYLKVLAEYFEYTEHNYNVVIFSDDILTAKKIFREYNFFYAEENNTHTHADNFKHYHGDASEQLILGTMMDNWIIGNSTFSWWQAWLATYAIEGKVIHSGKVFSETGNMKHVDTKDYYPENWIKFEI